ncbi:hypothetical protein AJ85_07815 [Alkalihalobacillus alcalophilus ATCC 27647 = CGMCC 1.3604]|uniref:Lipoprotein n=2 Tax=Bacillaceae TaxID=186817 RepID=A0A094WFU7_ALKAL|nr:hypothetical protein BALCAV_0214825 [Alkalihalobacillus alcalophilus ATCC 27647 = CGMCC 1.3604]THG91012.1 hypothetical protein AJ85_07815 [Alkalihalobacillus alcalophilus ATCC 27647 = CGMCC 1.3604]
MMNKKELTIVIVFIVAGLGCLTFPAVWLFPDFHRQVSFMFFTICVYALVPLIIGFSFFFYFRLRRKRSSDSLK